MSSFWHSYLALFTLQGESIQEKEKGKKIIMEQKINKHVLKSLASSINIVAYKSIFQRYLNVASKENLFPQLRILESQSK